MFFVFPQFVIIPVFLCLYVNKEVGLNSKTWIGYSFVFPGPLQAVDEVGAQLPSALLWYATEIKLDRDSSVPAHRTRKYTFVIRMVDLQEQGWAALL